MEQAQHDHLHYQLLQVGVPSITTPPLDEASYCWCSLPAALRSEEALWTRMLVHQVWAPLP